MEKLHNDWHQYQYQQVTYIFESINKVIFRYTGTCMYMYFLKRFLQLHIYVHTVRTYLHMWKLMDSHITAVRLMQILCVHSLVTCKMEVQLCTYTYVHRFSLIHRVLNTILVRENYYFQVLLRLHRKCPDDSKAAI